MTRSRALPPTARAWSSTSVGVRVLAGLAVAALLAVGVLGLGRLAPSALVAGALTTAWFAVVGAGVVLLSRRHRKLLIPLTVGYVAMAVAAGALLVPPLVTDRTVNEAVVTGGAAPAGGARTASPVQVASGAFSPLAHDGSGRAALVRLPDGRYRVTLAEFETDNGPDLRVYLVPGNPGDGAAAGSIDLGGLKGNRGNQQYAVPATVDPARFGSVVIWCRAFAVGFVKAALDFG